VAFTSSEDWMERVAKSVSEYMEDVREAIAKKIEDDHTGDFDVI
jgi:hypothetical protein